MEANKLQGGLKKKQQSMERWKCMLSDDLWHWCVCVYRVIELLLSEALWLCTVIKTNWTENNRRDLGDFSGAVPLTQSAASTTLRDTVHAPICPPKFSEFLVCQQMIFSALVVFWLPLLSANVPSHAAPSS